MFISVLGCVRIRKLVETRDVLSHSGAPALTCSEKVLSQCHWDRAVGSSSLLLSGMLVAILVTSFAPQSFSHLHQSVLRCSWPGKGQKLFSPCIVKADIDTGNAWVASSSREVRNISASSVYGFHSAGNTHSPALVVGDHLPDS